MTDSQQFMMMMVRTLTLMWLFGHVFGQQGTLFDGIY